MRMYWTTRNSFSTSESNSGPYPSIHTKIRNAHQVDQRETELSEIVKSYI